MSDHENPEPCEGCGEVHEVHPFGQFLGAVSEVVFGARFIANDQATLRLGDTELPITVVGLQDDDGEVAFFALALDDNLSSLIQFPEGVCGSCVDEQADEILRHVDLDAPLPFLNDDNTKEQ